VLPPRLASLALLVLLLAACAPQEAARPHNAPAAPPASPSTGDYPPLPAGLTPAEVARVVDGDTIAVTIRGREERVRFIGINTPESVDPRRPVQCYGKEASDNAKALLEGRTVLLEDDPSQDSRDSNGRLLRYVWLEDGRMANLEQVAQGFAAEYTYERPYKYRDVFRRAQREAEAAGRGLWSPATCNGEFSPLGEAPAAAATPTQAGGDPASCPELQDRAAAPEAPVRIAGLDKAAETVELRNVSDGPVSLDGWVLCSQRGGESQRGVGGTLAPGETRAFANPAAAIWSNGSRDDAALFDPAGRLVSYWEDR
jgi:micrococcal nuclease